MARVKTKTMRVKEQRRTNMKRKRNVYVNVEANKRHYIAGKRENSCIGTGKQKKG